MISGTPTLSYDQNLDQPYLERLNGIEVRPVFIVAPHRSGTTLLYRTLAESEREKMPVEVTPFMPY